MFLQETFVLEDNYFYDDATSDKTSSYSLYPDTSGKATGTLVWNNNQYCNSTSENSAILILVEGIGKLADCEVELTFKPSSTAFSGAIGLGLQMSQNNSYGAVTYSTGSVRKVKYPWADSYSQYYNGVLDDAGDGFYTLKVRKQGNTVTFVKTGESFTITGDTHYVGLMKGVNNMCFNKVKIKAL